MPKTHGVVIVGANPLSVAIAEALTKVGVDSVVCDSNWDQLRAARILGLKTYYGNPSSDHAGLHLNLSPYGYMLGLSNHFEYNVTQATSFRDDFGARNVFILPPNQASKRLHKHVASAHNSGRILFDEEKSYSMYRREIRKGAKIKVTELSEEYTYEQWASDNPDSQILMALKTNGDIVFDTVDEPLQAETGSKLFYMADANQSKEKAASA